MRRFNPIPAKLDDQFHARHMAIQVFCPQGHLVIVAVERLDGEIACPHCFATFHAEVDSTVQKFARKEERRGRPSDDEDDEDEADEKPKRKAKPEKEKGDEKPKKKPKPRPKDEDEDEEDEKPRKKAAARKKSQKEEEDDDEDEEDGPPEEEEEPIEWTPRKRRLNMCRIGLYVMMGSYCILMLFTFLFMLVMDFLTYGIGIYIGANDKIEGLPSGEFWTWLFAYTAAPFGALAQLVLLVGFFLNLMVPPKVEGKGPLIAGIVFGGLVFLAGILILLASNLVIVSDEARAERLVQLMGIGAALCFIISTMSAMAYHGKLLAFFNLKLEASQPMTNTLFYYMYFVGMFVVFLLTPYACYYLHPMISYILIVAIDAMAAMAIRMLLAQVQLFLKSGAMILQYIKDS